MYIRCTIFHQIKNNFDINLCFLLYLQNHDPHKHERYKQFPFLWGFRCQIILNGKAFRCLSSTLYILRRRLQTFCSFRNIKYISICVYVIHVYYERKICYHQSYNVRNVNIIYSLVVCAIEPLLLNGLKMQCMRRILNRKYGLRLFFSCHFWFCSGSFIIFQWFYSRGGIRDFFIIRTIL